MYCVLQSVRGALYESASAFRQAALALSRLASYQQVDGAASSVGWQVTRAAPASYQQVDGAASSVGWQVDKDFALDVVNNFVITCVLSVNLLFLQ